MVVALDRLQAMAPKVESVSLVVAWFGNDLRVGDCKIWPGVEVSEKTTSPQTWSVNGVSRTAAHLVSRDDQDRPVYGGTPADFAVIEAIKEVKARGLRVTLYPFILMDVPPGNTLPNPYSDNAAETGQPAFPWRGRITCSPAAGLCWDRRQDCHGSKPGRDLLREAPARPTSPSRARPSPGPVAADDWGLRRMVLHYAHLCAAAGGVDAFLIGTEMRGLTTIRSGASAYPAVRAFRDLAADVRAILGAGTAISYAADWSEYFGHQPGDGSGDVFFHLDPLWADAEIDFVGIDNYMPLSDWRDGFEHADALEGWPAIYDRAYLQGNIAGGEGYDWFYASAADRSAQVRTPITDGAASKPWVFRYKDLRSWWSNAHYDRPGGVESGTPTAWAPQSKPIWFTELGCPAIDRGTNQPNVFFDPKSSESFVPYFLPRLAGRRHPARLSRSDLPVLERRGEQPDLVGLMAAGMVHVPECAAWTWDARPYPFFPALTDVWTDGGNWRLGHWLTGRLGAVSLAALVRHLCLRAGLPESRIDVTGLWGAVEGYAIGALESPRASITTLARHFGFDAVETEGVIRFVMRGRASVATVSLDDLVAARDGDVLELTRGQETELPQALKWQVARADEDYEAAQVEARRITVDTTRIASESFPMAVPPEEAERRCRRALMEAWTGRESTVFRLPPSRLALDPADVVSFAHDGRAVPLRLVSIADADARGIEAIRQDREAYDLPPGAPRPSALSQAVVFGAPEAVLLDLPQLSEDQPAHRPLVAAHAVSLAGRDGGVPQSVDGRVRAANHIREPRPDRRAGLGLLRRTDIALRPRQCAGGRSADRHAGKRHGPDPVRRGERARRRERARRLGDRAGGRGGAAGARPVSADPASPRPARHRGCHGQPGSGRRADRGARRQPRLTTNRGGRSRHPVELAHRHREPPGQRRDLCRAGIHAFRRRAAAVLGRPCRAAVAHAAHARRSDHPLDTPVPRAGRRQLGRTRGADGPRNWKPMRWRSSTALL